VTILWKILSFLFVFGILVLIHEFGHFITAKLSGVRVETFSFGFGKKLLGKKIGDTEYRISLVPLGGYVKMAGEEAEDVKGKPDEFESQPKWKKFLILLNGSLFNIILAVSLMSLLFLIGINRPAYLDKPAKIGWVKNNSPAQKSGLKHGDIVKKVNNEKIEDWEEFQTIIVTSPKEVLDLKVKRDNKTLNIKLHPEAVGDYQIGDAGIMYSIPAKIGQVVSGMPASRGGLQEGDKIIEIDDKKINNYFQMREIIINSPGKTLNFKIKRNSKTLNLNITPKDSSGKGSIGVVAHFDHITKKYSVFPAIKNGFKETVRLVSLTYKVIKKLFTGKLSYKTLSGPIDIADFSYAAVRSGSSGFLQFLAFISLQLGIINLLPIPALDGGHLFVLLIEVIARKDFTPKWKERIAMIGFYLLITLSVLVIINDILKRVG